MRKTDVVIAPVISEKSTKDAASSKFTFRVAVGADKNLIKKVIEEKFKVNVVSVSTTTVKGKKRRFGMRRIEKAMPEWKKAIVALKKDQKIDLFDVAQG